MTFQWGPRPINYHGGGRVFDLYCSQPPGGNQNIVASLLGANISPILICSWSNDESFWLDLFYIRPITGFIIVECILFSPACCRLQGWYRLPLQLWSRLKYLIISLLIVKIFSTDIPASQRILMTMVTSSDFSTVSLLAWHLCFIIKWVINYWKECYEI